ncbi:class I SAM-dependent methyltransferase [Weeksellaceae bacterium A-14]
MDWFETWFDTPYYHILYKNHDYSEAEAFITKLTAVLQLPEGARIIDLACGKGRHSVFLNKLGYDVLGLDLSRNSIEYDEQFENPKLKFAVHDIRNEIIGERADAVFNLFTSFGYFKTEGEDQAVFDSVAGALKKDGFFVLDYLNQQYVRNTLTDRQEVQRDGITFHIHKRIEDNYVIKEINFDDEEGEFHSYFERVKLHTPEKILKYAERAGFERIRIWGDYQLDDFDEDTSPRCINLFRKV